jgi:hypothetical protein
MLDELLCSEMFFYLNNPKNTNYRGRLWHFQPEAKQNRNRKSNGKPDSNASRNRCRCEDQSLLTLKERINLAIKQNRKLPSNEVDKN